MTAAQYGVLLLVVTFFSVLAVAQRTEALHLGYRLMSLESEQRVLAEQNRSLLSEIGSLTEPTRIADGIRHAPVQLTDPAALSRRPADDAGGGGDGATEAAP